MVDSLNNNSQIAVNSALIPGKNADVISNDQNKIDNSNAIAARLQNDAVRTSSDISIARDIADKITLSPKAEEIVKSSASETVASSEVAIINAAANQNNNIENNSDDNIDEVAVNEIAPVNDTNQVKRDDNRTGVINGNQDNETEALRSLGKIVDQFA